MIELRITTRGGRLRECRRHARGKPDHRAEAHGAPTDRPAVNNARRSRSCRRRRTEARRRCLDGNGGETALVAEAPQHAGESADQIRHAPPSQRLDTILHPGEQQEQPNSAVTQVAMTRSVPISSDIDPSARRANINGRLLTDVLGTTTDHARNTYHGFCSRDERSLFSLCRSLSGMSRVFREKTFENCDSDNCRFPIFLV
jgi:hypothetical protein